MTFPSQCTLHKTFYNMTEQTHTASRKQTNQKINLEWLFEEAMHARAPSQYIKTVFPGIEISIIKMRLRGPSYVYNGNSYTGKTASLYWDAPWAIKFKCWFITIINTARTFHRKQHKPLALWHSGDIYTLTLQMCNKVVWRLRALSEWTCHGNRCVIRQSYRAGHPVHTFIYWGRDKMDAISQTTFSSAFSWMKMFEFQLKFHWSLFLRVQLTIFQHWFR